MKEIIRGEEWVLPFYNNNENDNIEYKLSDYVFVEKCDDGYLLLHTITWSLFLLNEFEYENILKYDYFKKWFIVLDKNINEEEIAIKVYLKRSEIPQDNLFETVNNFVIFTTNKCNAQCFYCYEKNNLELKNMSLKTADDVANFIIKKCNGAVNLQWFGGEPLLNTQVINNICEKLMASNIQYTSKMISNSLLFTDENINLAKNKWNLKTVQITLDGLYEVYNSIKNYKNTTINAFEILINNIKNILQQSNITIMLRLNVSENNYENMENILVFLKETFMTYINNNRLKIHWSIIFQIYDENYDTHCFLRKYMENLEKKFPFAQYKKNYNIIKHYPLTHCMADSGRTLVIDPFGKLALCEHWRDIDSFGNIYSDSINHDILNEWLKKDGENIEFCKKNNCRFLPMCTHYNKCEVTDICKNKIHLEDRLEYLKRSILMTYEEYKNRINQIKNGEE